MHICTQLSSFSQPNTLLYVYAVPLAAMPTIPTQPDEALETFCQIPARLLPPL